MTPSTQRIPQSSIDIEKNTWADFVELLCLTCQDAEISLSDISEIVRQEKEYTVTTGTEKYGEENDRLSLNLREIFRVIDSRAKILGDTYPFKAYDSDTIGVDKNALNVQQIFYCFLLYCANLYCFSKSEQASLTHEFESLSKDVLQCVFPNFRVEIFGTASSPGTPFYGGTAIERFETLAKFLHTQVTQKAKANNRYQVPAGDGGLDVVGFVDLEDSAAYSPYIPMCFAQCTCSPREWKSKQHSIRHEEWHAKLEDLPYYCEFIIVPFSLRNANGMWSQAEMDQIMVIPIDRIRILHILKMYGTDLNFFAGTNAHRIVKESFREF